MSETPEARPQAAEHLVAPDGQPPAQRALSMICFELGLAPTPAQCRALDGYQQLLLRWNQTYNLTAIRDADGMRVQHLADCLAVLPAMRRQGLDQGRVLDVGSGAGLPGVVLAVMLPQVDVFCVDTVGKKAAFIRQVASTLHLPNLRAIHSRVQDLRLPAFDLITSRAFASLADFCVGTATQLSPTGVWMAMKGKKPVDELAVLAAMPTVKVNVFHVEHITVPGLNAERCLVWMRRATPT